jgi:hypothetical protein
VTNEERTEDLIPVMGIPEMARKIWSLLSEESRVRAEWFTDESIPDTPGKVYIINPSGYWFNA